MTSLAKTVIHTPVYLTVLENGDINSGFDIPCYMSEKGLVSFSKGFISVG